jgi:protein TonB
VRDRPTALGGIRPRYPRSARLHGQEGRVGVRAGVDAAGRVVAAAVVRSSGHAVLDDAALEAVRTARFVPAERNGRPVAGETTLQFQFRLSD